MNLRFWTCCDRLTLTTTTRNLRFWACRDRLTLTTRMRKIGFWACRDRVTLTTRSRSLRFWACHSGMMLTHDNEESERHFTTPGPHELSLASRAQPAAQPSHQPKPTVLALAVPANKPASSIPALPPAQPTQPATPIQNPGGRRQRANAHWIRRLPLREERACFLMGTDQVRNLVLILRGFRLSGGPASAADP